MTFRDMRSLAWFTQILWLAVLSFSAADGTPLMAGAPVVHPSESQAAVLSRWQICAALPDTPQSQPDQTVRQPDFSFTQGTEADDSEDQDHIVLSGVVGCPEFCSSGSPVFVADLMPALADTASLQDRSPPHVSF